MKKNRGKFLTAMIIFDVFGKLQSLYLLINTNLVEKAYPTLPSWFYFYQAVGYIIGFTIIIGMWLFKKWAVYLLAFSTTLAFIMQLFAFEPVYYGQLAKFTILFSAGLYFWAILRKWKSFD